MRLLSVSPNPAQIVVVRQHKNDTVVSTLQEELDAYREKAGEAERIRDSFRSDNVRLTHRISYLEEQVAELLARVSKGELTTVKTCVESKSNESQVQIFQKGPKVTLINNVLPNKSTLKIRDTLPTVQNTNNKLRNRGVCKSVDALTRDEHSQYSESSGVVLSHDSRREESTTQVNVKYVDKGSNKSTYYTPPPNSSKNKENYYNLLNERRLRYIRETQNGLLNCNSPRGHKQFKDDRSCKSADFDSEPSYQSLSHSVNGRLKMYDSETSSDYPKTIKYGRPIPPQKPLRLSLHKGCSLQSVKIIDKSNSDADLCKNYSRRSQKLEIGTNESDLSHGKCSEKWC